MNIIQDIINDVSNRRKHFLLGTLGGFVFTILFTAGLATGMELKDMQANTSWDWRDWFSTIIGGIIGNLLQILFIWILS